MRTEEQIRLQGQQDPAQLESEIVRQRDHISELVRALEGKLSPGEMFSQVWAHGKGGGREFAGHLGDTVKANPVPTLLTAAGLAWLYARSDSATAPSMQAAGTTADGDHVPMRERAQHAREAASGKLGAAKTRASSGFHHLLEQNPMALGAMGVAAGAMLGALIPPTQKEHELMGEASARLKQKLRPEPELDSGTAAGVPGQSGLDTGSTYRGPGSARPGAGSGSVTRNPEPGRRL